MRPRLPLPPCLRAFALVLAVALAGLLALAAPALAGLVSPERSGEPAGSLSDLYHIVLYVAIVVFVGVEGTLLYSVVRFRARKGRQAAQIRGNTRLEIGWTIGAALIIVALTAITFALLGSIKNPSRTGARGVALSANGVKYAALDQPAPPGGRRLKITVNAQQFVWRFAYPNKAFAYNTMVVPADTTVTLDIRSQDVDHSWWIPKLGPKFDAVPGYTNHAWFKVPASAIPAGRDSVTYRGQCSELCGYGHANMVAWVRVVRPERYVAWVAAQKRSIDQANAAAAQDRPRFSPIPTR